MRFHFGGSVTRRQWFSSWVYHLADLLRAGSHVRSYAMERALCQGAEGSLQSKVNEEQGPPSSSWASVRNWLLPSIMWVNWVWKQSLPPSSLCMWLQSWATLWEKPYERGFGGRGTLCVDPDPYPQRQRGDYLLILAPKFCGYLLHRNRKPIHFLQIFIFDHVF